MVGHTAGTSRRKPNTDLQQGRLTHATAMSSFWLTRKHSTNGVHFACIQLAKTVHATPPPSIWTPTRRWAGASCCGRRRLTTAWAP